MKISLLIPLLLMLSGAPANSQATAPTEPAAAGQEPASANLQPNPPGVQKIGDGVLPPKLINQVEPEFSDEARRKKISGMSVVNLIVDAQGNATNVHILHSMVDTVPKKQRKAALSLDLKAVEAVQKYKFSPATLQGKPVPVELNVEVNFRIF